MLRLSMIAAPRRIGIAGPSARKFERRAAISRLRIGVAIRRRR
jgi:hypothetical protein